MVPSPKTYGNAIVKAYSTPVDLMDAIEDAETVSELMQNLRSLRLVGWGNLTMDKQTKDYVRIKGVGPLGNVHYLKVAFAEN